MNMVYKSLYGMKNAFLSVTFRWKSIEKQVRKELKSGNAYYTDRFINNLSRYYAEKKKSRREEMTSGLTDELIIVKDRTLTDGIVLVCVVKDDLYKIKRLTAYYKELGIENFIFLDNHSTDGTKEYLMEQDVILLETEEGFRTVRKLGWINQILYRYCLGHYVLVVDSDEFLTYPDIEERDLNDYLAENKKEVYRCLMLDMYSTEEFSKPDFYKANLFDNRFHRMKNVHFTGITGGMRERLFGIQPQLTKHG